MKSFGTDLNTYDYQTWQVVQEYLPKDLLNQYKKVFNNFDVDREGVIKIEDFTTILSSMGHNVSEAEVVQLLRNLVGTVASNSFIDFKEFIVIVSMLNSNCVTEDEMLKVFRHFDKDGDGFISIGELRDMMLSFEEDISELDLQEMIGEADQDGDGKVSYNDFIRFMTNSNENHIDNQVQVEEERSYLEIEDCQEEVASTFPTVSENQASSIETEKCKVYKKSFHSKLAKKVRKSVVSISKSIGRFWKDLDVEYDGSKKSFFRRFSITKSRSTKRQA